jgi:hypothetical protein
MAIEGIQGEALFLFTRLTSLRLRIEQNDEFLLIKKIIQGYQNIRKLEFIGLEFWHYPNLEVMDRELLAQINSIKFNQIEPYGKYSTFVRKRWDDIFLCGCEIDAEGRLVPGTTAWPALTELVFSDFKMVNIDVRCLADYFPRLEKLDIGPDSYIQKSPVILTNEPFYALNNLRVLKIENLAVHSIEVLGCVCMPLLDELFLNCANDLNRINSFPHFPKLTKLKLVLKRVKLINPKAFDHFTQLTRFEIECKELEASSFETGVAARSMSFHVACMVLKLNSISMSAVEEIQLINCCYKNKARLETLVALSELKKLSAINWADEILPFQQMINLEHVSLETNDLSICKSGRLKFLTKLKVLEVKKGYHVALDDFSMYFFY